MGGPFMHGCMWIIPLVLMVLFFILFRSGVFNNFRFNSSQQNSKDNSNQTKVIESALDILKKRYAKGEITKEEYDDIKANLW